MDDETLHIGGPATVGDSSAEYRSSRRGALHIALIYALSAALWILFSDQALEAMFTDPAQIVRASMIKGWLFVAVTALLLYLLVVRLLDRLLKISQRQSALHSERLRALQLVEIITESSNDAIFAKDLEGRYILFNRAASDFVGKPAAEVLGHDEYAIFPAEQAAMLQAAGQEAVGQGSPITREERLTTPGGERVFLATKGPLRDADGKVVGLFGISRDITAQKQVEAELIQLTDDLTATLHAIPDLLFELDEEGRYVKVGATADALLAAPAAQLAGRRVGEILPAEAAETVMAALTQAQQTGADYGRTISLNLADGLHYFELSVARKALLAGAQHFVVLSRDITARKLAELELLRNNEALERFNTAAVGREMQMVALKRQINDLSRQLGQEPPFDLSFVDTADGNPTP